ncbi:MAG: transglycosylase SLT domain-containing protein [Deltaproteobacteria bacterium]|nr:MAG: transglycosylase SLT domain-containing protein [Deltaproteobacteria bacterium]
MTRASVAAVAAAWIWSILVLLLMGCATTQKRPQRIDNICEIFRENESWYENARESSERWSIPIPVLMAIIYQESKFEAKAKPPRSTCLFIFPGPRPSSAYGYAQALDETWDKYKSATGNSGADRDDFGDSVDFIGWYCRLSYIKCGIARNDAYNLYLAYHEGHGGFNRKTYRKKAWLKQVARSVQKRARTYSSQLASCEGEFQKKGCCLWPF